MKTKISLILFSALFLAACQGSAPSNERKLNFGQYENYTQKAPPPQETQAAQNDDGYVGISTMGKKSSYGDAVVTVASKKITLGQSAGEAQMTALRTTLDGAYASAQKTYRPLGFTYTISPVGAINPLSDIQVACVLSEESAQDVGQQTCNMFFNKINAAMSSPNTP